MNDAIRRCLTWYQAKKIAISDPVVANSRDLFMAKLDNFYSDVKKHLPEEEVSLIVAIAGEIGNNCFDHNMAQWQDIPGCWFDYAFNENQIWFVIADRGQGILSSLHRVDPSLKDDQSALEAAFHRTISGRSPEKRGNGLKLVREVVLEQPINLYFTSGDAEVWLRENDKVFRVGRGPQMIRGCLAKIEF